MLEAALLTGIGVCWILSRFNLKRIAGYAWFWDVATAAILSFLFIGTYAGMVTGMAAAVLVSAFLSIVKRTHGIERLRLIRKSDEVVARPRWVEIKK